MTIRELLSRQLMRSEVEIVLRVLESERRGKRYVAGRLELAQSLVDRHWLSRDSDGMVHLVDEARVLLMEAPRKP